VAGLPDEWLLTQAEIFHHVSLLSAGEVPNEASDQA
jgi:hypothetical protein